MESIGFSKIVVCSNGKFKTNYSFEEIRKMSAGKHFNKTVLLVDFFSKEKEILGQIVISFGEIDESLMKENLKLKRDSVFSFSVNSIIFSLDFLEKSFENLKIGEFSVEEVKNTKL